MVIIIPAKSWGQSKTRLSPVLSKVQRVELSRGLLLRTIALARLVGDVVVVSRDAAVRRMAKQSGAWALVESGHSLNRALRQATTWVMMHGGRSTMILPADLPRLQHADLTGIIELGRESSAAVIAPCQRLDGTNALLLRPPDLIEFTFGPGSFAGHQQAVRAIGLEALIFHSPTLAFDLDLPEDLEQLNPKGLGYHMPAR